MPRSYTFRLTSEGFEELKKNYDQLDEAGKRWVDGFQSRIPGLNNSLEIHNRRMDETRQRLTEASTASGVFTGSLDRAHASMSTLINRYLGWTAVMVTANKLMHAAAETSDELKAALARQDEQWNRLAASSATFFTSVISGAADALEALNNLHDAQVRNASGAGLTPRTTAFPGVVNWGAVLANNLPLLEPNALNMLSPAKMGAGGNWIPGGQGFPAGGVTDLSQDEARQQKLLADALDYGEALQKADRERTAKRLDDEETIQQKLLADALEYGEALQKADRERMSKRIGDEEELQQKLLADALKYGEELAASSKESLQRRTDDLAADLKRQQQESEAYWDNVTRDMRFTGKDFWMDFAETGRLNFKGLTDQMRSIWASVLFDMARQGKLFGDDGMFGGGLLGGKPGQTGSLGFALSTGALIAGALQDPNGNTRTGGALGGAASGALYGSAFGPIGTAVGAVVGAIAGAIGGSDKPSNYRATATFGSGMGSYGLSGDKPNENTLGLADQAAAAIMAEVQSLKAFGVEFQAKLSNIWIGQRDQSTYQLSGGQRIGVGSVGDAGDLAKDTLAALLGGATSSDPGIQAVLKSGAPDLLKALQFYQSITTSLAQITDPLQAAIDLWKKESQARLDMAATTGVSIEKVQQLNAELYKQTIGQVNAPVVAGIGSYLQTLSYGPSSTKSPGDQYASGLADYNAAKAKSASGTAADAAAYLQATQTFLPFAKDYLGVSKQYESLQTGAISTLQGLADKLAPPDMVTPIVTVITSVGAATIEQLQETNRRMRDLHDAFTGWAGDIGAIIRTMKPT